MNKKLKIVLIIITIIILFGLLILINNKTFFKNDNEGIFLPKLSYYVNNNTFYNIRSFSSLDVLKNNYLDDLENCYDESYYYDKEIDKSIIRYSIEPGFLKKIVIEYEDGNICDQEYILDDSWYDLIKEKDIISTELLSCKNDTCDNKNVNINLDKLIRDIKKFKRIENSNPISYDYENKNNYLSIYLSDQETYSTAIKIFPYNKNLAVMIINDNDKKFNAIYEIDEKVNKYILSLIK